MAAEAGAEEVIVAVGVAVAEVVRAVAAQVGETFKASALVTSRS